MSNVNEMNKQKQNIALMTTSNNYLLYVVLYKNNNR